MPTSLNSFHATFKPTLDNVKRAFICSCFYASWTVFIVEQSLLAEAFQKLSLKSFSEQEGNAQRFSFFHEKTR